MYPVSSIIGAVVAALLFTSALAHGLSYLKFPLPDETRRIGCVDGLRGYLALFVVAHHFVVWLQIVKLGGVWEPPSLALFNEFGAGAVCLFFMTTGLVFYPRILAGFFSCNWLSIYISRIFRILPAVALSLVLVVTIVMLRTGRAPGRDDVGPLLLWLSAKSEPPLLGYADSGRLNAYVLWSLHFEWLFYFLVLPACALARDVLRRVRGPTWTIPLCLIVVSLAAGAAGRAPAIFAYLPSFAIGMLAYECFRRPRLSAFLQSPQVAVFAGLMLLIGMVGFASPHGPGIVFFGCFFVCVAAGNTFWGLLSHRGALALGECSFSIYLFHGLALNILFVDLARWPQALPVAALPWLLPVVAGLVVLFSAASFLGVERPAIRAGAVTARRAREVLKTLRLWP